ncbi:MAG: P-II family nitrogen regulator [Desulfovibrionaceae bacterium]|nr:P-II family nitrogen regulator [Desulfovibrionaceae bacterium]
MAQAMFRPAKLLIAIAGKYSGQLVVAACKRGGARGGTKAVGRGMARYFTGGDNADEAVSETLIFSVMHDEADNVVRELIRTSLEDPEHISGMALVVDVAAMARPGDGAKNAQDAPERAGSERMDTGNTLITCIITRGLADEIMRVARQAGAGGGTILSARGTGTEDDVKFFGISLAPEKEMLLIVARNDSVLPAILDAVCALPVFSEPGGGIVYTTPVDGFYFLGS